MAPYRQDAAPAGGYKPITWAKEIATKRVNGYKLVTAVVAWKVLALGYFWNVVAPFRRTTNIEENDCRMALTPMLTAELDRQILTKQRANRDKEAYLMRNNPNWQVGKLYNEDLYSSSRVRMNSYSTTDEQPFQS